MGHRPDASTDLQNVAVRMRSLQRPWSNEAGHHAVGPGGHETTLAPTHDDWITHHSKVSSMETPTNRARCHLLVEEAVLLRPSISAPISTAIALT